MRKVLYTFLYITSLAIAGLSFHQAFAQQRAPSVEPLAEIEIGSPSTPNGFDFSAQAKRVPATATIRQKTDNEKYSSVGPILFFIIALPFALWTIISKKFKNEPEEHKAEYYSNVSQFQPYKTEYQKHDEDVDDDDIDYPKSA
jgi:hypothetical protein